MYEIYEVNYKDPNTGAISPIDTIIAPIGYTAEDYIKDCRDNADPDWCEFLDSGEVIIYAVE